MADQRRTARDANSRSLGGMIFLMHGRLFVFYGMRWRFTAKQSG